MNLARLRVTKVRRFREPRTADCGKSMQSSERESQQSNRQSLLPSSFLARRHLTATASNTNTSAKKRRVSGQLGKEKTYTKDIVCLLLQQHTLALDDSSIIPIPRGKARGTLAELGLIGKVRLVSTWSSARVTDEITIIIFLFIWPGRKRATQV